MKSPCINRYSSALGRCICAESGLDKIQIGGRRAIYYPLAQSIRIFNRAKRRERKTRRLSVTWRFCYTMCLTYCSQNREEQGGGEGQARASATAGAAAARSAARSARLRRFRVGDSTCTCDSGRSSRCHRTQRLQHQWYPGYPGASSGSQWQQHQEETQR